MKIGFTMTEGRGELDRVLADVAERAGAEGLRTCGIVQINTERPGTARCDMDVRILPGGPDIRISQSLGPEATGCRLDPDGLETAVAEVGRRMEAGFDVFILNKFGKQEAEGRGFREMIGRALEQGASVIAGTNGTNRTAFEEFAGGMAENLPPDPESIVDWLLGE